MPKIISQILEQETFFKPIPFPENADRDNWVIRGLKHNDLLIVSRENLKDFIEIAEFMEKSYDACRERERKLLKSLDLLKTK